MIPGIHHMLTTAKWRSHSSNYGSSVAIFASDGTQLDDDLPIERDQYRELNTPPDIRECQRRMDAAPNGAYLRHRTATGGVKSAWKKRRSEWMRIMPHPNYPAFL